MNNFFLTLKQSVQVIFIACLFFTVSQSAMADDNIWQRLQQGGYVLLIRHTATEPGLGDPPQFKLGECSTQRNLSAEGRDQARAMGRELQQRKIPIGEVLSSEWCRCIDTAQLVFGKAKPWQPLNSTFSQPERATEQAAKIKQRISAHQDKANLVLVTHHVIIGALVDQWIEQGEMVIVAPDKSAAGFQYIGRLNISERAPSGTPPAR